MLARRAETNNLLQFVRRPSAGQARWHARGSVGRGTSPKTGCVTRQGTTNCQFFSLAGTFLSILRANPAAGRNTSSARPPGWEGAETASDRSEVARTRALETLRFREIAAGNQRSGGRVELCADLGGHLANLLDRLEHTIYRFLRFLYRAVSLVSARILHHQTNGEGINGIDKPILDPPAYAEQVLGAEILEIVVEWAHSVTLPWIGQPSSASVNLTCPVPYGPTAPSDAMQTLQFGDQLRCVIVNRSRGCQPNHSRFAVHPMMASSSARERNGASRGRKFRLRT